jgi:hypothetical protein
MHVSFKIHYRNNLIDKKDSYLHVISCPPSWDDRNYSYGHQLYPSEIHRFILWKFFLSIHITLLFYNLQFAFNKKPSVKTGPAIRQSLGQHIDMLLIWVTHRALCKCPYNQSTSVLNTNRSIAAVLFLPLYVVDWL